MNFSDYNWIKNVFCNVSFNREIDCKLIKFLYFIMLDICEV